MAAQIGPTEIEKYLLPIIHPSINPHRRLPQIDLIRGKKTKNPKKKRAKERSVETTVPFAKMVGENAQYPMENNPAQNPVKE
jgi:hypothetical protein